MTKATRPRWSRDVMSGASDPMAISLAPFERQFLAFGEAIQNHHRPAIAGEDGIPGAGARDRHLQLLPRRPQGHVECLVTARPSGRSGFRLPSANLGPGFDALGMALGIYLECRFAPAPALKIAASGRDAEVISLGEDNLIWQTALAVAREAGATLPPIELEIRNDIPIGKGLGSSAGRADSRRGDRRCPARARLEAAAGAG